MSASNIAQGRMILKVFIGAGIVTTLVGTMILVNSMLFTSQADLVVARVIENPSTRSTSSNGRSATMYQPIFTFTDVDSQEVTAQVGMSSSSFNYRVNADVEIYHIRGSSPPRIRVAGFSGLYFMPTIFLVIGIGFIALGTIALRAMRKHSP